MRALLAPVALPDLRGLVLAMATAGGTGTVPAPSGGAHDSGHQPDDPERDRVNALVTLAQQGDAEAFGLVYDRYVDQIYRYLYYRVGSHALAEDLTSETFLRALRRIDSFTYTGKDIGAWFTTIARNLVTDHVKSSRFKLEVSTADMLDADRGDDGIETQVHRPAAGRRPARRGAPAQAGAAGVHRAAVPAGPVGGRDVGGHGPVRGRGQAAPAAGRAGPGQAAAGERAMSRRAVTAARQRSLSGRHRGRRPEGGRPMTIVTPARRRQADDLQALLDGGRASSPASAAGLADLVSLARALTPVEHAPDDAFRAALRDRLVTEAAARVPAPVVPAARARPSAPSRLRQLVATVAVASVVAGVGAAAASTRALPGDTLYGLKRQLEAGQLALARGDLGHGRELLEQADARLTEAERLTAGEDGSDPATRALVGTALREMAADVTAGAADLTEAYQETGDGQAMTLLDRFVVDQRERLQDLLRLLDPSLRPLRPDAGRPARRARRAGHRGDRRGSAASDTRSPPTVDGWAVSRRVDAARAGGDRRRRRTGRGRPGRGRRGHRRHRRRRHRDRRQHRQQVRRWGGRWRRRQPDRRGHQLGLHATRGCCRRPSRRCRSRRCRPAARWSPTRWVP